MFIYVDICLSVENPWIGFEFDAFNTNLYSRMGLS